MLINPNHGTYLQKASIEMILASMLLVTCQLVDLLLTGILLFEL